MEQIVATVRAFAGAHVNRPEPGDGSPEAAWGDVFFFYAPDGHPPRNAQPYATIVTKDHPGDAAGDLDPPGRWRVSIHVGRAAFRELTGEEPDALVRPRDHAAADAVAPHPVYGPYGWIAVVNPAARTADTVLGLLRAAHDAARGRFERRHGTA
ncbi:DUF6194 family protein [Streptomyces sp. NPDC048507]|uniref:DUF6194 family protein n=1 Tax=Streptomyces sp. NPDC048507 TaxID=3365560 RepID=UPI0037231565